MNEPAPGRRSLAAKAQQVLLLMVCAWQRGWISDKNYFANQDSIALAWRGGGFKGLTTSFWVWSAELIYLSLSHRSVRDLVLSVSEVKVVFWAVAPPVLLSYVLYMDWKGSRSAALARYEGLPDDMKNVWFLLSISYMVIPMCLWLVLVAQSVSSIT